jgi:hypothetical protein
VVDGLIDVGWSTSIAEIDQRWVEESKLVRAARSR